tara:strand:+ start:109 stop:336 length:228 start_codon:yes stop_codon:yes gene_type:complete
MVHSIKKITFSLIYNSSILLMLIIGIQNSSNKNKVNFFLKESVELPVSFIVGVSFISGSILGSFIKLLDKPKEEN